MSDTAPPAPAERLDATLEPPALALTDADEAAVIERWRPVRRLFFIVLIVLALLLTAAAILGRTSENSSTIDRFFLLTAGIVDLIAVIVATYRQGAAFRLDPPPYSGGALLLRWGRHTVAGMSWLAGAAVWAIFVCLATLQPAAMIFLALPPAGFLYAFVPRRQELRELLHAYRERQESPEDDTATEAAPVAGEHAP